MKILTLVFLVLIGATLSAEPEALVQGWLTFNIVNGTSIVTNIVRLDGSEQETVHAADGLLDTTLSADGRSLIGSRIGPHSTIVTLALDGTGRREICTIEGYVFAPTWSPDMRSIAFCLVEKGLPRIYLMTAEGKNVRPVSEAGAMSPHWARDGKRLAYVKFSPGAGKGEIKLMNVATGAHVTVLESGGPITDVAYSPHDGRMAYIQAGDGDTQVFVIAADAVQSTCVTHTPGVRNGLKFSPDGETLYYSRADRGGNNAKLIALVPGGEERAFMQAAPGQSIMMNGGFLMFWPTIGKLPAH